MENGLKILSLLGVQLLLGKRGAFPYGLLLGFSLLNITILMMLSDIIQVFFFVNFLGYLSVKIPWLHKKNTLSETEKKMTIIRRFWARMKKWGAPGLVAIAAFPYGGGALTGSIFAISQKIERKKAFFLIVLGCIIGSLMFHFGFTGLKKLLK